MARWLQWLTVCCCLVATGAAAAERPAKGRFLVAARDMQSPIFAESVVLLLNYDADAGAMGVIVNHRTSVGAGEVLPPEAGAGRYPGPMYVGGPVEMHVIIALLRTERPPATSLSIFGDVHLTPPEKALAENPGADASRLRFYVGYAGWAPGQLEGEIARGDWHIRPASADLVFAKEPDDVWRTLVPPQGLQVAGDKGTFLIFPTRRGSVPLSLEK